MFQKAAPTNYCQRKTEYQREKGEREWGEKTDNPFVSVVRDLFALGRRIL